MPYIPMTADEMTTMLAAVGVADIDELWREALGSEPQPSLDRLPAGKSEFEVRNYLESLARQNADDLVCFVGSGFYDHFTPAAVSHVISRGEFSTSYTPYQPEVAQGTLQAVYEFQSAICRLTGMEVANASMYDGGTALFEAIMMAVRMTRRRRAVVLGSVSPIYLEMIRCYCHNLDLDLVVTDPQLQTPVDSVVPLLSDDTACVVAQYPNVFGVVEDLRPLVRAAKARQVVAICSAYPTALAVLEPPGRLGFDLVTGEGQALGLPLSFGGPYLGFMAG